jgi:hypothetical protein
VSNAKGCWVPVQAHELGTIEPYRLQHHSFTGTAAGKPFCVTCGLLLLRNPLTDWCVRKGCYADDHPGWKHARATLPAQHQLARSAR